MDYPVRVLEQILAACRPDEPLEPGDPRYLDVSSLRHGAGLSPLKPALRAARANVGAADAAEFVHKCVCGHRGSGKSTELHIFERWAREQGFCPVRIEVDKHLGMTALDVSDLFLLAAMGVEECLTEEKVPVPTKAVNDVTRWFAEVVREDRSGVKSELGAEADAQIGGSVFSFVKLLAKFTASVKSSSEHALSVRQRLRNFPDHLVRMTNALMRDANEALSECGHAAGLLLIFDNLDRYPPADIERVLFQSCDLMRLLRCHAIFVVPISLEYESSGPVRDSYGPFTILPMLTLRRPGDHWKESVVGSAFDEEAVNQVVGLLAKRIDIAALFEDPADARLLVKYSGGCQRDLLHLVTEAFNRGQETDTRLTSAAVQGGIRMMLASYKRKLDFDDYAALARIAAGSADKVSGDLRRRLLYGRFALEYVGADEQPWLDVHPLVVEIPEFQNARRDIGHNR
jgi:hypothetical protein